MKWFFMALPFLALMVGMLAWFACADTVVTICCWVAVAAWVFLGIFHEEFEE